MDIIIAAILALTLDLLLGDPEWLIHPVVIMGQAIDRFELTLRARFSSFFLMNWLYHFH